MSNLTDALVNLLIAQKYFNVKCPGKVSVKNSRTKPASSPTPEQHAEVSAHMKNKYGGGREEYADTFSSDEVGSFPIRLLTTDSGYIFEAVLPGYKKEDIEITTEDDTLSIKATAKPSNDKNRIVYSEAPIPNGAVERQIQLSDDIDKDSLQASFHDGVLSINVARTPKDKPYKITIE